MPLAPFFFGSALGEAVHHAQAEVRTLADLPGRVKRFEHAAQERALRSPETVRTA